METRPPEHVFALSHARVSFFEQFNLSYIDVTLVSHQTTLGLTLHQGAPLHRDLTQFFRLDALSDTT